MKQSHIRAYAPRLLITMPWGIGDTIVVGLTAVDQITQNDPAGTVEIDVLCNHSQVELLEHDPRIHRLIQIDASLFPTAKAGSWKRGIFLSPAARKLAPYLRDQHYSAILPFMFALAFFIDCTRLSCFSIYGRRGTSFQRCVPLGMYPFKK